MSLVGTDEPYIETLVENTVATYLVEIVLQRLNRKCCFCRVLATSTVVGLVLKVFSLVWRVYPFDGGIPIENAAILHARVAGELATIELMVGKLHDSIAHAVLDGQQTDTGRLVLHNLLHERMVQPALDCFEALDGGRQLAMIASQDDAVGLLNGYPATGFQGLCCLIDEKSTKLASHEQMMCATCQGARDDTCLVEKALVDLVFEFSGSLLQSGNLLVTIVAIALRIIVKLADCSADAP